MLVPGRYMFNYGIYYPEGGDFNYEVQFVIFMAAKENAYGFERPDWWVKQIVSLGDFYIRAQFGEGQPIDYRDYRTIINLTGKKEADNYRQETDTISRLVYGMASCYLLTGEDRFLEGAEKGTVYLRDHMRFYDTGRKGGLLVPRHRCARHAAKTRSLLPSLAMTMMPSRLTSRSTPWPARSRPTASPAIRCILKDAEMTVDLFERFYLDKSNGGYFSHLDPITLDPRSDSLGAEQRQEKLEFGRRPCPGLPDQPVPGDRRKALRRLPGIYLRHHRSAFPGLREQPVRPGKIL